MVKIWNPNIGEGLAQHFNPQRFSCQCQNNKTTKYAHHPSMKNYLCISSKNEKSYVQFIGVWKIKYAHHQSMKSNLSEFVPGEEAVPIKVKLPECKLHLHTIGFHLSLLMKMEFQNWAEYLSCVCTQLIMMCVEHSLIIPPAYNRLSFELIDEMEFWNEYWILFNAEAS